MAETRRDPQKPAKKAPSRSKVPPLTHEASIRKFVQTYFRVAQVGLPGPFLSVLAHNEWFKFPHNPVFMGWIAFGHLKGLWNTGHLHPLPPYIAHLAPYLAAAKFYITEYVKTRAALHRERYMILLREVNRVMRDNTLFPETIRFGVDSSEVSDTIKRAHQAQLVHMQQACVEKVAGLCVQDKAHGPFVESSQGTVCTTCGQVGQRAYFSHYSDMAEARIKLKAQSTASRAELPDGAMEWMVRMKDPTRSMTRGQFILWTERAISIPVVARGTNVASSTKWAEYTVPPEFREWLLFLYDFIKDCRVDHTGRTERLATTWAHAIWIYGYLVWITVHRATHTVLRAQTLLDQLHVAEATQSEPLQPTLQKLYRCLETRVEYCQVVYVRVEGTAYRFYPPVIRACQFMQDIRTQTVYADNCVRSLVQLIQSPLLHTHPVRAKFWDSRYHILLRAQPEGPCTNPRRMRARATACADECYFHLAVPRAASIRFVHLRHTNHVYDVIPWTDPYITDKCPNAQHFIVHIAFLRGPGVVSQLVYQLGTHPEATVLLQELHPSMKRCVLKLGQSTPLIVRPATIGLTLVSKEVSQVEFPPN